MVQRENNFSILELKISPKTTNLKNTTYLEERQHSFEDLPLFALHKSSDNLQHLVYHCLI